MGNGRAPVQTSVGHHPSRSINIKARLARDLPWIGAAGVTLSTVATAVLSRFGWDSHAYWLAAPRTTYTTGPATDDAYLYSPAFAEAIRPLTLLPWPYFAAVWSTLAGVVLALLLRPLGWRRALPLWLCCSIEVVSGNVYWLFALVAAYGLRFPALWAVPALTKITPAVGLVWFLLRREWRNLAIALAATLLIAGLSYCWEPEDWHSWFLFLGAHGGQSTTSLGALSLPPVVRIPAAAVLVGWGALTERPWTLPAGMVLAAPVFGIGGLVVLAALPVLQRGASTSIPEATRGAKSREAQRDT
jgi:hypothetical protein